MRSNKHSVMVGSITIGGSNHVVIQSMTNTKTSDTDSTVKQINELISCGCEIVRVAILDEDDAKNIKEIKKLVNIPIVADIHFDYKLAILSVENGADKIRINPGNIQNEAKLRAIIERCKAYNVPIRIGVNSGSIEKEILEKHGGPTPDAMLESMDKAIKFFENEGFTDLVLSIKATDIASNILVNEELNKRYNYPIHIGLTESGTVNNGTIRSSYALGTLLNEGIGNTIRVSLHGNPVKEIPVVKEILSMFNLYTKPTLIVCPTCGRTKYEMTHIVNEIEDFIKNMTKQVKIAIMGCVVNGPGEAKDADIGIAGGEHCAVLFKHGKIIEKLPEDKIVDRLKEEILKL